MVQTTLDAQFAEAHRDRIRAPGVQQHPGREPAPNWEVLTMSDATEQPPAISATERIVRSLGNHLTLIETHAAQCRRQLAEFALTIEARD